MNAARHINLSKGYTASGYLPSQGGTAMLNMKKKVWAEIQREKVNDGRTAVELLATCLHTDRLGDHVFTNDS